MQLCIDQGNSSLKMGIFEQNILKEKIVFDQFNEYEVEKIYTKYAITSCIYSSVGERKETIISFLKNRSKLFIELTHETVIPINNLYKSPETLGKDRLAAVIGASYLQPETDILVIDTGSAITFDFIDKDKVYRGGNISPGLDMRLKALHHFTKKLPLVVPQPESPLLGNDTNSAILSGVLYGIYFEMDGYIERLKLDYPQLSTFLTGGNTFYFANRLKNAIFADKNLVLTGLNCILQYNAQK